MLDPIERVRKHFVSYAKKLQIDYEDILDSHPGDLGDNRERGIAVFLKEHLPSAYQVYRGGKVIDTFGRESKQVDVIICNSLVPQLVTENKTLYFVEGVMGAIESKSFLSKDELRDCLVKCGQIKRLTKVYEKGSEVVGVSEFAYKLNKVHFSVFAYDSPDLQTVTDNVIRLSVEMGLDPEMEIDCVCVLRKGIIFKPAAPGLDGGLQLAPARSSKGYIYKSLEFEGLAYFLLQLQKEFAHIRYAAFDMTRYVPSFLDGWGSRFYIGTKPGNPKSNT